MPYDQSYQCSVFWYLSWWFLNNYVPLFDALLHEHANTLQEGG